MQLHYIAGKIPTIENLVPLLVLVTNLHKLATKLPDEFAADAQWPTGLKSDRQLAQQLAQSVLDRIPEGGEMASLLQEWNKRFYDFFEYNKCTTQMDYPEEVE